MSDKIIVTNLRIPEEDWAQVKITAADLGMSANEYVKEIIQEDTIRIHLGEKKVHKKRKDIFEALLELANKEYKNMPEKMSEEDEIIYEQ